MTLSFSGQLDDSPPAGDRRDLAAIFQLHSKRVTGLCRHLLRDDALAQGAASEVFVRVREAIGSYEPSVPMDRWLLRIAANFCIDLLRRRRLERRWFPLDEPAEPPVEVATPLTLLLLKEQREAVERSMGQLEEAYRLPLVLRYYADLSYDEIAAELGIEKTQVAGRIFRAKQLLRVMLKETV